MRKLIAALLALSLLLGCGAMAEGNWIQYNFGDFNLTFPEDVVNSYSEERIENQPFCYFYQDYDEGAAFVKNLNIVWASGVDDISAMDPAAVGKMILDNVRTQFESMGVLTSNEAVLSAEAIDYNGLPAIGIAYTLTMDYGALVEGLVLDLVFVQMLFSDEAFGTYNFTLTTDDIDNTQLLTAILDSLSWNV